MLFNHTTILFASIMLTVPFIEEGCPCDPGDAHDDDDDDDDDHDD
ncbi:hypothetical protein OV079_34365 [Nannocystis pusilla]|uniref:Uncharacterized protein n=1 Tax=Nannocystis pusilla TaxID=889268 RepID=A0A9X3F325_9BACT|nr:hypothetical protein [Nannocystis pusilla]MCY1010563.1 hypothetical protein [Nannocystis pusilla]